MPVAPGTYHYYLAPWAKDVDRSRGEEFWIPPAGTNGLVDLRPVPAQGTTAFTEGFGFFAVDPAAVPEDGLLLGDDLAAVLTAQAQADAEAMLELSAGDLSGETVVGALWRILTDLAEASGDNRVRPLSPTISGDLNLHLGGHSLVRTERYSPVLHPFVIEKARYDFARLDGEGRRRTVMLEAAARKLGVRVQDLTAPSGGATYTESFGTTAAGDLGPDLTWAETLQTWQVTENAGDGEAAPSTNNQSEARAEHDTDTDDMYAEVEIRVHGNTAQGGARCRYHTSDRTYYAMDFRADVSAVNRQLYERVTGTLTSLASADILDTLPAIYRVEADGSDISGLVGGSVVLGPVTDTTITGNTRGGITGFATTSRYDDFEMGDLGAGFDAALMAARQVAGVQPVQLATQVVAY